LACTLPAELRKIVEKYSECNKHPIEPTGQRRPQRYIGRIKYGKGAGKTFRSCEDGLKDGMHRAGARFLGYGVHRNVFAFSPSGNDDDDCVVKVARDIEKGAEANLTELRAWKSIPRSVKPFFARTDDADPKGLWITQERAETFTRSPNGIRESYEVGEDIKWALEGEGMHCRDLHPDNVGHVGDRPVIVDYGLGLKGCGLLSAQEALSARRRERVKIPPGQQRLG
jgi:hypothetical protein